MIGELLLHAIALAAPPVVPVPSDPPAESIDFFESRIRPLLSAQCFGCHGAEKQKANLRLDHIDSLMEGGDSGPAVVRGDPDHSRLIHAVCWDDVALQMPPKGKLGAESIADLRRWVEIGVPWPREPRPENKPASPPVDVQARKRAHWAWQPLADVQPPKLGDDAWSHNAVDAFLLAKLREHGLAPAPEADRATLLRRLSFDLIGLPPTPDEVAAFAADDSEGAYEREVDRLLASPRFGERWARHWMDLFRYAETYGHEFDYPVEMAWRYRDYLIRALNADVPYDAMLREHLAGDLLVPPRLDPETGTNESVLATAQFFFPQATHGPVDARQDEADRVDNQIDVLTKSFLGMTVACARCHDHKFDAISTRDYYALAGFIKSSRRTLAMLDPHGTIGATLGELRKLRARREARVAAIADDPSSAFDAERYAEAAAALPPPDGPVLLAEAEALKAVATEGEWRPQEMALFGAGTWSGDRHMWWTGAKPGAKLAIAFDVPRAGRYRVEASLTKARDYGIVAIALAGTSREFDLYDTSVASTGLVTVAEADLQAGAQSLEVEVKGANPQAVPAYMFGLDQLRVTPLALEGAATIASIADGRGLDRARFERFAAAMRADAPEDRSEPAGATRCFEDFADARFANWKEGGLAFGGAPALGRLALGAAPRVVAESCAHSGVEADRLEGTLRSRSFTIDSDWILYRVKGTGARIRLIIDSYQLDVFNDLLFEGVTFGVDTGDTWTWHAQRAAKYRGHRAHVELLDQGPGWLAVDRIVFADSPDVAPPPKSIEMDCCAALETGPGPLAADGAFVRSDAEIAAIDAEYAALAETIPPAEHALAIEDGFAEDEYVFLRGRHDLHGADQPRRSLEALDGAAPMPVASGSGRLELADRWLAADDPLPARVAVNRVFHHLFGRGIVPSVDNFGVLGEPPSHPELLDWLARWFRADARWSQKALIRLLVTSSAYRMSSALADDSAQRADPANALFHRANVRRLEGEAIRDALLAISGRLDLTMFGPSVPVHLTAFMDGRGRPGSSGPLDGAGRRSVYQEVRRNFLPPLMLAFDTPLPATTAGRRSVSNVPAQGLILMNDPLVIEEARLFAERVCAEQAGDDARIDALYESAFARAPSAGERELSRSFLTEQAQALAVPSGDPRAWADLAHALLNAKEFVFLP